MFLQGAFSAASHGNLMTKHGDTKIVALVTSAFGGIGGIETFNRALIGALDQLAPRHNWTVRVLSLLDCEDLPRADRYLKSGRADAQGFSGNRAQFAFVATRASYSADMVIIGHTNLAPLALLMNSRFKCLIVHGIEVWKKLSWLRSLGISRIDRILSVSAYTQREMMRENALTANRFRIFPNTLDPQAGSRYPKLDRSALGLPRGHMLLSVTRLASSERYKNIRSVIESLPTVLAHMPDTFYVVIGDGAERKVFEELGRRMGLAGKIFLPGGVPSDLLSAYYDNCDLFVLPSVKEGFGIVFLEAMSHRKACIGARAGGVPEVIRDGDTGILVAPTQLTTQIPEAILHLLRDPALRKTMGEHGRKELERNFSFDRFCDRLEQILCSPENCVTMSSYARPA
jgi:phosphatidyl-myo-inositol dimannoside synthase